MTNLSAPFILRPIGATLAAIALMLVGLVAYAALPVASLPAVDSPTIGVYAYRPGADPETMAASVAAPLERALGGIAGVNEITSQSLRGYTRIIMQFEMNRGSDRAARDVQAALNAAAADLPADMPYLPGFYKTNPAAEPVLLLALTSDTFSPGAVYDAADSILLQRVSQVAGVGQVEIRGGEQPAIRIQVDGARLAATGISADAVRQAVIGTNAPSALGAFDGPNGDETIALNDELTRPEDYRDLIIGKRNGVAVRLGDVADVQSSVRNERVGGWYDDRPSVIVRVSKKPEANVIETVDAVKALLSRIQQWMPAGIDIHIFIDRTATIRGSVLEIQRALLISIGLVMVVVFLFLRRAGPTLAAGITVPLSLCGAFAAMWLWGYSIDIASLLALTVSVGFVIDDAIVMIENIDRNIEAGMKLREAALLGAKQIGFTVVSISASLLAAFVPIMFLEGPAGKVLQEFSVTLGFAVAISGVVSLTVTPMILSRLPDLRASGRFPRLDRLIAAPIDGLGRAYARSLGVTLAHPWLMLIVILATLAASIQMYISTPKGYFPQNDGGFLVGFTEAPADVSFPAMARYTRQAQDIVRADPAIAHASAYCDGSNYGEIDIFLKPPEQRGGETQEAVLARLRASLAAVHGLSVYLRAAQEFSNGGRPGKSVFQFTLLDQDVDEMEVWAAKIVARLKQLPELIDVSTDRNNGGLQASVRIDRAAAARLGVSIADIDNTLADAFTQRPVSVLYGHRNQYRVILETRPQSRNNPNDLAKVFVPGRGGAQIPLTAVASIERGSTPLAVNHQSSFPATTISYNVAPGVLLDTATKAIRRAVAELHLPEGLRAEFAGDAKAFNQGASREDFLILFSVLIMYIVLGILYESLIHPITIISTLPSAGLGALITLHFAGLDLGYLSFIGIILLIGIVKKNGIMMVDFALAAERAGMDARAAIEAACVHRFRPILMTTLTALFGAVPLAIATGAGAE